MLFGAGKYSIDVGRVRNFSPYRRLVLFGLLRLNDRNCPFGD